MIVDVGRGHVHSTEVLVVEQTDTMMCCVLDVDFDIDLFDDDDLV